MHSLVCLCVLVCAHISPCVVPICHICFHACKDTVYVCTCALHAHMHFKHAFVCPPELPVWPCLPADSPLWALQSTGHTGELDGVTVSIRV